MNKNPATADQLLELAALQIKRLKDVANQEKVKDAIQRNEHPFWAKFDEAVETLKTRVETTVKSVVQLLKTITVGAVNAKTTADCFTDRGRYYHRDGDLDKFLPKVQREQPESNFTPCRLTEAATFKQMAENALGVSVDIKTLSKLLKGRGHTTTLPAIEALIERQENGEDIGLLTNGWANFFFVDNEDGESVSVVSVRRSDRRWDVRQYSFGRACGWAAVSRFFFRNFSGN